MIRIASVALPKSPMNLAQGDEVPQIITRRTRQRPPEFLTPPAKRLLQHNPFGNGHRRGHDRHEDTRPKCLYVSRDSVRAACVTTFVPSPKEAISQRDSAI